LSAATRQMHLGVFVLGAGNHSAGWRWEGAAVSNNDLAVIQEIARIAERGKFDLLFVSDGLDYEQGDLPSFMCRFEPTSLISVLSAHTTRLGLGATVSTSFTEPYNVARLFASIDHISQGRAAWNVVTSSRPKAALNFNFDRQMDHELRYQRAEEFVDVVKGLWDCWQDGALVADKASAVYIAAARFRPAQLWLSEAERSCGKEPIPQTGPRKDCQWHTGRLCRTQVTSQPDRSRFPRPVR
jgi:alkanesulfonate monooxygenase SsuD/methylene tetrahydromethanopterin reductase-like flavin-dependent oxidoreductase (luciferase family)